MHAPPLISQSSAITSMDNGVESSASEWQDVVNPATGEAIAQVPLSDAAEVTAAIEAAAAAYPDWRRTPPEDRIQPLFKLKALLEEHIDDLARIITQENGKTFAEAKGGTAPRHRKRRSSLRHSDDDAGLQPRRRRPRHR